MKIAPLSLCFACLIAVGCGGVDRQDVPALGKSFALAVGEQSDIRDENIRVRFVEVEADSRCPTGVQCVRAGEATILVGLEVSPEPSSRTSTERSLTIPDDPSTTFEGYEVRLNELNPYPADGDNPEEREYSAVLIVTKP